MLIFGIETSCDETAASIVEDGVKEICSVVSSSKEFHEKTGGIVPEVAARKQVESIVPVISECFEKAFFIATEELKKRGEMVGADAIICMRQDIDMDTNGFAFFYLQMYGTAVKFR